MRASSRSFFFCNPSHSLFNFISNPPDLFNRSSFRIVQAPVNQLLLHRCEHRLRTGFLDEQPIVTTSRAPLIMSAVNIFGDLLVRSIPRSLIAATTTGLTRADGTGPALNAFNPSFSATLGPSGCGQHFQRKRTESPLAQAAWSLWNVGPCQRGLSILKNAPLLGVRFTRALVH